MGVVLNYQISSNLLQQQQEANTDRDGFTIRLKILKEGVLLGHDDYAFIHPIYIYGESVLCQAMCKAQSGVLNLKKIRPGVVVHTCNPSTLRS